MSPFTLGIRGRSRLKMGGEEVSAKSGEFEQLCFIQRLFQFRRTGFSRESVRRVEQQSLFAVSSVAEFPVTQPVLLRNGVILGLN